MKLKPLPLLLLPLIALLAFKPEAVLHIKRSTNLLTGSVTDYRYNAEGQVTQISSSKGDKTTYTYSGRNIIQHTTAAAGKVTTDTMVLNEQNRVEMYWSDPRYIQRLKYDKQGHLIEAAQYINGKLDSKSFTVWQGDNIKGYILQQASGKHSNNMAYIYYTDKLNTVANANRGMAFLGTDSKNLCRTSSGITNTDTIITQYKYTFDKQGAVVLKAAYNSLGKLVDSTGYSYYR